MPETSEYTRLGDGGNQSLFVRWQYLTRLEKGLILITTVFGVVIFSLAIALAKCDAQAPSNVTTVAPETTTEPTSTTVAPNITTLAPTSTTVAPTSTTVAPTSTTVAPTSTTVAPTSTTVAPTSTTIAPTSTTVSPTSTTVAPVTTTVASTSTTVETSSSSKGLNEAESVDSENIKQLNTESTFSSYAPISESVTKLLKNIPPISVTGIKLISLEKDETNQNLPEIEKTENNTVTSEASVQKYSEDAENNTEKSERITDAVLSRIRRVDISSTAESKKDNPIYE